MPKSRYGSNQLFNHISTWRDENCAKFRCRSFRCKASRIPVPSSSLKKLYSSPTIIKSCTDNCDDKMAIPINLLQRHGYLRFVYDTKNVIPTMKKFECAERMQISFENLVTRVYINPHTRNEQLQTCVIFMKFAQIALHLVENFTAQAFYLI